MHRFVPGLILVLALLAWAMAAGGPRPPESSVAEAKSILEERFADWRGRVERAAARMVELAAQTEPRALFVEAQGVLEEEGVHGVALLDWDNRSRCWAGRTFQLNPKFDFYEVKKGIESVDVLEHPAHKVLMALRPAGREIAVAFYVFDETFPQRRDLGAEVAAQTGLAGIELSYGMRTVPVDFDEPLDHYRDTATIDHLVYITFHAHSEQELLKASTEAAAVRWNTLIFVLAAMAAWHLWRRLGQSLASGSLLRLLLGVTLLVAGRFLLSVLRLPRWPHFNVAATVHPVWAGPGDILLSAIVILAAAIALARTARAAATGRGAWICFGATSVLLFFLPGAYEALLEILVRRPDGVVLFDALRVEPGAGAAMLLAAVCALTVAVFLVCQAAYSWARKSNPYLVAVPFLMVALGLLPWRGPLLAAGCLLVVAILRRAATRPGRAAALAFLTAVISFPILYTVHRAEFVHDVATRARDMIDRHHRGEAEARLEGAVARATSPLTGEHFGVADAIARGVDPKHLAFRLWAASDWNPEDPCAVQVWDMQGRLLSTFDFDSPPAALLPGPPDPDRLGPSMQSGRGAGELIHFYTYDILLRTNVDNRPVGHARFLLPDRWDVLLTDLRPSMFGQRHHSFGAGASRLLVMAELAMDGAAQRCSEGTTADLPKPGHAFLSRALHDGYAAESTRYRGQDALQVLTRSRYQLGALLFQDSTLQQGSLAFAKILLVNSAICLLYVIVLLIARRQRIVFLFRHRVALFLVLVAVVPVLLLAAYDRRVAAQRHETEISERLERRLDLAETQLRSTHAPITSDWCTTFAADYQLDINIYEGQDLVATSRPGVWDTGLLARRLAAAPYLALVIEDRTDVTGREYFTHDSGLRAAYRKVRRAPEKPDLILAAPALDDRRDLERRAAESSALLLAIYLTTAMIAVFVALYLARSLAKPVRELREATQRVATGDLTATLSEGRADEFGDLVRAFNRMTRELRDTQDLRVRVEKAAAWREMARQVAHEIKNPLTPIKLTVQNLLAAHENDPESFGEEFESGARVILDQIEALQRIAGEFSAYARFPVREAEPVDLNELIEEVAALFTGTGDTKVETEPAEGPLVIPADRDELRRALINLVTNSQQAHAQKILLRCAMASGLAVLSVHDDGAGINQADMERIWEPSFTTKSSGTGLGMPIVKRVVDDHGGKIEINSTAGQGTSVILRLPL